MKTPTKAVVEIVVKGLDRDSLKVRIAPPKKREGTRDYCCRITSSRKMGFRVDVFGIIPQDAVRMALQVASVRIAAVIADHITDTWTG